MKILHTADWHIGSFPGPEKDGVNLRAEDTVVCLNHLQKVAAAERPQVILVSGDIFHQARVWADRGLREVEVAIRTITQLSKICPVVVMRGTPNHDGAEQFAMLKAHFHGDDSVHICTEPEVFQIKGFKIGDPWINVACLPGFDRGVFRAKFPGLSKEEENQVFTEELSKIVMGLRAECEPLKLSVLMSHYTVPGCNTESGQTQFLAQFEPMLLPETLDAAGFDLVALGHIHRPQQLESCSNTFYSGAVNALNFNDEDQERGFWIHDLNTEVIMSPGQTEDDFAPVHTFHKTPAREFLTFRFTQTDIEAINYGEIDEVADNYWRYNNAVDGKIVRVLYSCDEKTHKAFNRSILEKRLYADGAFWVSEISPEQVTTGTNKDELSEKTDPEKNLLLYLNEKGLPDTDVGEIIEAARPIIGAATASVLSSQFNGAFIPICIEVKNYRNYAEASFDFTDISFCTINGVNGAGKSSLFMDAILDCLYEEPREGDLTGWIRADEKARSGSIIFTFAIGDHTFRVTRTRTKSGKATLNIAELVNDEWLNRSAEKIKDTQARIENILGMDSLTFRSCALIMQDQYGLFLQAPKEDRMQILSNILGLGIYNHMEQIARSCLKDLNSSIASAKTVISTLSQDVADADQLEAEFIRLHDEADTVQKDIDAFNLHRENLSLRASAAQEAASRAKKIDESIFDAETKKAGYRRNMEEQERILRLAEQTLSGEDEILAGAAAHPGNLEEEKRLLAEQAALKAKADAAAGVASDLLTCQTEIRQLDGNIENTKKHLEMAQNHLDHANSCAEAAQKFHEAKQRLDEMEGRAIRFTDENNRLLALQDEYRDRRSDFIAASHSRKSTIEGYEAKIKMLADSRCMDVENASCRFLADAKAAKAALEKYRPECTAWKEKVQAELDALMRKVEDQKAVVAGVAYEPAVLSALRRNVEELRGDAQAYERRATYEDLVEYDSKLIAQLETDLETKRARLAALESEAAELQTIRNQLDTLFIAIDDVKAKIAVSAHWVEKQAELPAARERKSAAAMRIHELGSEIADINKQLDQLRAERIEQTGAMSGLDLIEKGLTQVNEDIRIHQRALSSTQSRIGAVQERLERIRQRKEEIDTKQEEVARMARKAFLYDTLKAAFSQDGIPHNIIRAMLPLLTSTANTILGQMTGGKMGMEFVTDKILKSNSKKEVPALDIIINEYGKDSLPYLSKSGGEKVKASLSAILSLAEIKSSQAGIQLGMLFIDEPPFLDADGIQAYCDALETIQRRYSNLKVMAITHDPTMKARFPQSIDIVKTEDGSRVDLG